MDEKSWYEKLSVWISIISGILGILGYSIFDEKAFFESKEDNKATYTDQKEESYEVVTQEEVGYNYNFTIPEEIDYKNVTSLNNYIRLRDAYGQIFAAPTCLYTSIEYDTENILFTGNDGSSFSYGIHDLIEELPEFSPKWTEKDIMQFITKSTNGEIENIEIISFSTTNKSYYVKGTDRKDKNILVYLMVALGNTMYRVLKIKLPNYIDIDDEIAKEYYIECVYRLSDFMDASEEAREYNEFYKDYKKY